MPQGFSSTVNPASEPQVSISIEVVDAQSILPIDALRLRAWATQTLWLQGINRATLSLVLVDDATIQTLNSRHLGHDWPTDVISFPLSDASDESMAGEIIISTETAQSVAAVAGCDPLDELAVYLVHGVLHLCGFDDRTQHDARLMHARQSEILAELGSRAPATLPTSPGDGVSHWTV
jgi:probable rRNA maturation factor